MRNYCRIGLTLSVLITISSCSFLSMHGERERNIASAFAEQMVVGSEQNFNEELDDQLLTLHQYYILAQLYLAEYDQSIPQKSLEELNKSSAYKALIVLRQLTEEIEDGILEAQEEFITGIHQQPVGEARRLTLKKQVQLLYRIHQFALMNKTRKASMENLMVKIQASLRDAEWPKDKILWPMIQTVNLERLKMKQLAESEVAPNLSELYQEEAKGLVNHIQFDIQKKNVEHLSLILDIDASTAEPRFYPSASKAGNITGHEFPAKVWSLTFDDGPAQASTLKILENLKERELKATFFQLAQLAQRNKAVGLKLQEAGMEIASHSWSHAKLTSLGSSGLEKEITEATEEIKSIYNTDIKYFRIPYGAGVSNAAIRNKIADNKLIHVFWSIDTEDWVSQTPEALAARAIALMKKSSKDSGVILMHDIHPRTAIASAAVMDYLKKDDRRVCLLDEIVTQMNEGAAEVCPLKK